MCYLVSTRLGLITTRQCALSLYSGKTVQDRYKAESKTPMMMNFKDLMKSDHQSFVTLPNGFTFILSRVSIE